MKFKLTKAMPIFVAALALVFVCFLQAIPTAFPGTVGARAVLWLKWLAYDARVRVAAAYAEPSPTATNLATLFIDDIAIRKINDGTYGYRHIYPWPRFLYGQIVRELSAQGANAIGFDILFSERHSASAGTDMELDGETVSSDEFFARQISKAGNVALATQGDLLPADLFFTNAWKLGNILALPDYGVLRRAKVFTDYERVEWHPLIQHMAVALQFDITRPSFTNNTIEFPMPAGESYAIALNPDGSLDFDQFGEDPPAQPEPPLTRRNVRLWSLGIVLAAKALGLDLDKAVVEPRQVLLTGRNGVHRSIPVDPEGMFYIDWSLDWAAIKDGKTPVHFGHIFEVLIQDAGRQQGEEDLLNPFKDRLVLIGSVATGKNVSDVGATPLAEETMLVTKHLNIASSLLEGRFIRDYTYETELLLILLMGVVSGFLTWRSPIWLAVSAVALLGIAYVLIAVVLFVQQRYLAPMVLPLLGGLMLPHFSMVSYRVIIEQREQRRVRGIFSKIVSPNVVKELLQAERLALGGARRSITVFFADVRGFTQMTDDFQAKAEAFVKDAGLDAAAAESYYDEQSRETLKTVNLYLSTVADMIKRHDGTLDKYMGDCVMAFWGAPTPNEKHALSCVRAAIDAQRAMYALNQERFAENKRREEENKARAERKERPLSMLPLLSLGTGINTGVVTVGLMGSDQHIWNYTIFGREVNLASRLEGVSGRGRILVSAATYIELQRDDPELAATCTALPAVTVKGIRQAVKIYEVPWKPPVAAPEQVRERPEAVGTAGAVQA